jgi:hypothetical protein
MKWHTIKKVVIRSQDGKNVGTLLYKLKGKWENESKSGGNVKWRYCI